MHHEYFVQFTAAAPKFYIDWPSLTASEVSSTPCRKSICANKLMFETEPCSIKLKIIIQHRERF